MAPLAERFRDALHEAGQELDPAELNLAVDMVRLLVRATGSQLGSAGRHVVDDALRARSSLNHEARNLLLLKGKAMHQRIVMQQSFPSLPIFRPSSNYNSNLQP